MKIKKLLQIFILLIISGFISSLFVIKGLEKKNYKHTMTVTKKVKVEGDNEGEYDVFDIMTMNFTLVTDTKEKFDDFSKLSKYLNKHLVEDNKNFYFLCDATGTFDPDNENISIIAMMFDTNGFAIQGPVEMDLIYFLSNDNEVSEFEFINSITDKVTTTKEAITESKLYSELDLVFVEPEPYAG